MKIETLKKVIALLESKGIDEISELKRESPHWEKIVGPDYNLDVPDYGNSAGKAKLLRFVNEWPDLTSRDAGCKWHS